MASVCANDAVPLSDAPSKKKKKKKKKNKKKKKKGNDANDDKVFRVVERAGRGRCVIATRDLSPGHELFTEIPYAFTFLNTAEKYCSLCTKQVGRDKNTQVNICPSCKITTYCSVECYNKDRVSHSQICSLICEARHIASKHDADAKILELLLKIFSKKLMILKNK